MRLPTLFFALAATGAVAAVGWVCGSLLLRPFERGAGADEGFGLPERALAGYVGFFLFSIAAMVVHMASRGWLFGNSYAIPALAAGVLAVGWWTNVGIPQAPSFGAAAAAIILLALFFVPVLIGGSSLRTGDPPWHLGWAEQLLRGDPLPTGPAPEYGRNAYPWGWHAGLATTVRLVPGSDSTSAHEAMHLLLIGALPLGAACIARRVERRAGWAAAGAAALIGGWGWIAAGSPDFVTSPSRARYGADLVVASPNSVYELFPPALPREAGLVTLAFVGMMLAVALTRVRSGRGVKGFGPGAAIVAGAGLGVTGLLSAPMFVAGILWTIACAVSAGPGRRLRFGAAVFLPSVVLLGLWMVPVGINYFRYGGFVNVSPSLGSEWPLHVALWSWGLLLPLTVAGVYIVIRSNRPAARAALACAAGSASLLTLALARGWFGWDLAGNATLLHQGRAWPSVHLLGSAFGGLAVVWLTDILGRRWKRADWAAAVLLAISAMSVVFASISLTREIATHDEGYLYSRADFDPDAFIRRAAARLSPDDVVRVEGSDFLGLMLFQFSGTKLATYDDARLAGNDLRIRYFDLARRWDDRISGSGFEADYLSIVSTDVPAGARIVARGRFREDEWVLVRIE